MNNGKFDGGQLSPSEKDLNDFYKILLSFSAHSEALLGAYKEIHSYNRENTKGYTDKLFSFVRWKGDKQLIVVSNFDENQHVFQLKIDEETVAAWSLEDGTYLLVDQLSRKDDLRLVVKKGQGYIDLVLPGLESHILKVKK